MGLSRMEKYLAVIKVLENWDSITLKQIICKADFNLALPKNTLTFYKVGLNRRKNPWNQKSILYHRQRTKAM